MKVQPHGSSLNYYTGQMWNGYQLNNIKTHWTNLTCLEPFEDKHIILRELEFYIGNGMYFNNHDNVASKIIVNMIK